MRSLFFTTLLISGLLSCNNDDDLQPQFAANNNYMPLKVGNYWVYEHYEIDSSGRETLLPTRDSLSISGDTMIRGNLYYIFQPTSYNLSLRSGAEYLRDSSGYLITDKGEILFSDNNFIDVLLDSIKLNSTAQSQTDTLFTLEYKMESSNSSSVSVPAGSFQALNYQGTSVFYYEAANVPREVIKRFRNNYYSNNIGKVLESYHYGSYSARHQTFERRLVRYQIK